MKYVFSEDPFHLAPIWAATLDVYLEFAKVCDRHGLRYYVTDGNAIGAVRHKGFIPWDDDFDVSMPRPDYEQFKVLARTELPSHLKFVNWQNTPEFEFVFGKIQDSRRDIVTSIESQTGNKLSNGIFIDIFPIDGYSEGKLYAVWDRIVNFCVGLLERFCKTPFRSQTMRGRLAWLLGAVSYALFFQLRTHDALMRFYDKRARRIPFGATSLSARASLCKALTLFYPQKCWGQGSVFMYNGINVPLPDDYDSYLKVEYPTYMELPPKEMQRPMHSQDYRVPWYLGPTRKN